jgi:quercetin dioxygenase-like cupin family protein
VIGKAVGAAAMLAAANGATEGTPYMEIDRRSEQRVAQGPDEYFTGGVTIRGMFARQTPSRVTGAVVTFEAGARTHWHSHPLGQTLIVTDGTGWTQVEGGPKIVFEAGDIIWCPNDQRHWHGATPHGPMTHIAIQEALDGRNVTWMEPVSEDIYLAGAPGNEAG